MEVYVGHKEQLTARNEITVKRSFSEADPLLHETNNYDAYNGTHLRSTQRVITRDVSTLHVSGC